MSEFKSGAFPASTLLPVLSANVGANVFTPSAEADAATVRTKNQAIAFLFMMILQSETVICLFSGQAEGNAKPHVVTTKISRFRKTIC